MMAIDYLNKKLYNVYMQQQSEQTPERKTRCLCPKNLEQLRVVAASWDPQDAWHMYRSLQRLVRFHIDKNAHKNNVVEENSTAVVFFADVLTILRRNCSLKDSSNTELLELIESITREKLAIIPSESPDPQWPDVYNELEQGAKRAEIDLYDSKNPPQVPCMSIIEQVRNLIKS
jgi:hypothetical protein